MESRGAAFQLGLGVFLVLEGFILLFCISILPQTCVMLHCTQLSYCSFAAP